MKPKEYVKKFRKFIKDSLQGTKLLPSIVMAHAMYEAASDDGSAGGSIHASKYNNDVRIPADRSWKGPKVKLPDRRITNTKKRTRKVWFRIYPTSELSIGDRIKMLRIKEPLWPTAFFYQDTIKRQAAMLQLAGVSNDPRYANRMVHLINKHKLYWMDRQWMIEKAIRVIIGVLMCSILRYVLQHWDGWVPWRDF